MNKKLLSFATVLVLSVSFCGCQLATADGAQLQTDQLIGVFVATEPLYLENTDRIYATLQPQTLTNSETGEPAEFWEYTFEGIKGIPMFYAVITAPDGESYQHATGGNQISDMHISVGDQTSIKGTIYITPANEAAALFPNPVYQSSDGRVYMVPDVGMSMGNATEGGVLSKSYREQNTVTEYGQTAETSFEVTISIAVKYPPEHIRVIQMRADHTPLSTTDYTIPQCPDSFAPDQETAYLIVETTARTPDGERTVRELFSPADQQFKVYPANEGGICEVKSVPLLWAQSETAPTQY